LNFLKKQLYFVSSISGKILVGFILCLSLTFIIVVLEPFDTDAFKANNKLLLLCGFGILFFATFVSYGSIENVWYLKVKRRWLVYHEVLSATVFFIFSGSVLYLYNRTIVNGLDYSFATHCLYLRTIVLAMIPIFAPLMIYLRQRFGERIIEPSSTLMTLRGENKNEILTLEKEQLLFIKAVENYIEICFTDANKKIISKTFRQTLSDVQRQLPFLEKCHKSYLVNISNIKQISGNSQSAKICFNDVEREIPLSKTYYKQIKERVQQLS